MYRTGAALSLLRAQTAHHRAAVQMAARNAARQRHRPPRGSRRSARRRPRKCSARSSALRISGRASARPPASRCRSAWAQLGAQRGTAPPRRDHQSIGDAAAFLEQTVAASPAHSSTRAARNWRSDGLVDVFTMRAATLKRIAPMPPRRPRADRSGATAARPPHVLRAGMPARRARCRFQGDIARNG